MKTDPIRFALFFGNRSFFPAEMIADARQTMPDVLKALGYDSMMMDESATRFGAVETPAEGARFARFLEENKGRFSGVILSLPNFGDETGAVAALKEAGVPILIHAYPDELDKMGPAQRRDSFCGKIAITDLFRQYGIPFTSLQPHTVDPRSGKFADNIDFFARVCRTCRNMKEMTVGAIGARTTPFKSVRYDELALQKHGISVETIDLSSVIRRVRSVDPSSSAAKEKAEMLANRSCWKGVPEDSIKQITALGVVLDEVIEEYGMDALAIRCWTELQEELNISPCVLTGELSERGIPCACEVDVCSAVAMFALQQASGNSSLCLDWNNNYGDEENKCILFHCGNVPTEMMTSKGCITEHSILGKAMGKTQCGYGCNQGRIKAAPVSFSNLMTVDGRLAFYLEEGHFTDDPIPEDFFGCAGVIEIPQLQDKLQTHGYMGYRHHVSLTAGHVVAPLKHAFETYLHYDVTAL